MNKDFKMQNRDFKCSKHYIFIFLSIVVLYAVNYDKEDLYNL